MVEQIAFCRIHPAIGIARVGNSPSAFYIGQETVGEQIAPIGGYKDAGDPVAGIPARVKRQAARFRIFSYNSADEALGELTLKDADIEWTVHLVNSKAEGDVFAGRRGEELPIGERLPREFWRNKDIDDRASLIIDPGPRTVIGADSSTRLFGGRFRGIEVPLGELRTDADGHLIVLGAFGVSAATTASARITNYANNDRWHDDVSDGPVTARVTLKSGEALEVRPAWVIVTPPDFAPAVENVVTLYDVATDTALRNGLGKVPGAPGSRPSFTKHIAPIFHRLASLDWVQQGGRGSSGASELFRDLSALQDAHDEVRAAIFARFRNPNFAEDSPEAKAQATADFVPALSGDSGDASPGDPRRWLCVTRTQYGVLERWRDGKFKKDWTGTFPGSSGGLTPSGLDRAALEACAGGAFYPGIEASWLLRNPQAYSEPFRLNHSRLKAGDVTRRMACPWQADFFECMWHWWPAQRPDEVLTSEAYRRILEIEAELAHQVADTEARAHLEEELTSLLTNRSAWTRGLPERSFEGDRAMIERWAQLGFVVSTDEHGGSFPLPDGSKASVETERGRYDGLPWPQYFHLLCNIEQNSDFLPKAKEIARSFFSGANYEADDFYRPFPYSPEALDQRMTAIYDSYVDEMNVKSRMDTGVIQWPVVARKEGDTEITKFLDFDVKRFSDRAVKERLRQRAPFNLVDGAWLQRIQAAGPTDDVRAHLFAIWDDEAGNGRTEQNHCNVYDALLRSLNIYMPAITSRKFIEQDLLPAAFIQPVFQLAVSLFPDEFFPEILGMTLYLEWEASPTLTPTVRHYEGRGIDPHFYSLHVAIDNITAGHGFMAKEAIKLYLKGVEDGSGSEGVEEAWRRIWCGYVTWATAGDLGRDLTELSMIIDHKQINLLYPAMLLPEHVSDAAALADRLAAAARGDISADALSQYLVDGFRAAAQAELRRCSAGTSPKQGLITLVVDELNRLMQGVDEKNNFIESKASFFDVERFKGIELGKDTQELLEAKPAGESLVKLNRLLLRDGYRGLIAEIPQLPPVLFPNYREYYRTRFIDLIRRKAYAAKPLHRRVIVGGQNLSDLFDDPEQLVDLLASSDLIDIEHPRSSRFFEALSFSGPMYKIFTADEQSVILDWIESLRPETKPSEPQPGPSPAEWGERMLAFLTANAAVGASVARHRDYTVDGKPLIERFDDPRELMAAFARSRDWVVPGDSAGSRLFREFDDGPMRILRQEELVRNWINSGAEIPPTAALATENVVTFAATSLRQHWADLRQVPSLAPMVAVAPERASPPKTRFAAKRKLIGMGAVH